MPISVQCSGCGGKFCASDEAAGKRVKCPKCATLIQVGNVVQQPTVQQPRPAAKSAQTSAVAPRRPSVAGKATDDPLSFLAEQGPAKRSGVTAEQSEVLEEVPTALTQQPPYPERNASRWRWLVIALVVIMVVLGLSFWRYSYTHRVAVKLLDGAFLIVLPEGAGGPYTAGVYRCVIVYWEGALPGEAEKEGMKFFGDLLKVASVPFRIEAFRGADYGVPNLGEQHIMFTRPSVEDKGTQRALGLLALVTLNTGNWIDRTHVQVLLPKIEGLRKGRAALWIETMPANDHHWASAAREVELDFSQLRDKVTK